MKRQIKTYLRTFYITWIIVMCLAMGGLGICTAYENTVQVAFGEYKKAVEITNEKIRILDFEIILK